MKNGLSYHGQMIKQECEAMLKALETGDKGIVHAVARRLNCFTFETLNGSSPFVVWPGTIEK